MEKFTSWGGGGLLSKAGQSDAIAKLKDQRGAQSRRGETGRALITICMAGKWQFWAKYCTV